MGLYVYVKEKTSVAILVQRPCRRAAFSHPAGGESAGDPGSAPASPAPLMRATWRIFMLMKLFVLVEAATRAALMTQGGVEISANLERLVLGCFEAKFCK